MNATGTGSTRSELTTKFIASVAERDVDFVILEELSVSPGFCEFLTSLTFGRPTFGSFCGAWHSLSDAEFGESDLLFIFDSSDGQRVALLIENKIAAPAQHEQAERYEKRGERGKERGLWDDYVTVLLAPKSYLKSAKNAGNYRAEISYEELMSYFLSRRFTDPRFEYKAKVIHEAIQQNRRGYQPQYSKEMTSFVESYHRLATTFAPQLNVEVARSRPAGSTWVLFHPSGYAAGVTLCHQLIAGRAKLWWAGTASNEEVFRRSWEGRLPADVSIEAAGKSMALVMEVPKIEPLARRFEDQIAEIKIALAAVQRLDELFRANAASPI